MKTLFDGPLDAWWEYRQRLVTRHDSWHREVSTLVDDGSVMLEEAAQELFPPGLNGTSSSVLAASATWKACASGQPRAVLVNAGGIYGGNDGPAGLWQYLAAERVDDMAFLLLDTGHRVDVAMAVLHCALQWLHREHPEATGRIILAAFSMGSATISSIIPQHRDSLCCVIIVSGQSAGTEHLARLGPLPVLIIHGKHDPMVHPSCALHLSSLSQSSGALVRLEIIEQSAGGSDALERMKLHHLRDERWQLHHVASSWLEEVMPAATIASAVHTTQLLDAPARPDLAIDSSAPQFNSRPANPDDDLLAALSQAASAALPGASASERRFAERAGDDLLAVLSQAANAALPGASASERCFAERTGR
eukprot:TRINITY_DN73073_c0_g1_i1.p1 TRINITY_DN73073_c0_g1~~TRINITY_DN73073_c0_g1_i1.p1  ORF type:complete len:364 (+),score=67.59 TRINITY_DN73073_c0_g1_i1:127-1218(+)